jgi:hypothetical protein
MTEEDPWDLIFDGKYQEALPLLLRDDFSQGHNPGLVLLALGRIEDALDSFSGTPAHTSARGEMIGTCLWLLGRRIEALQQWKIAQEALYQDAAGGVLPRVLRFYAAVRLNDENERLLAVSELEKFWNPDMQVWPSPIVGFLLGRFKEDEFTWKEHNSPLELQEAREVQICFWKGLKASLESDWEKAKSLFAKAYRPSGHGILEVEHFLARHELEEIASSC